MRVSAAFAPVPQTPDHIALAEELGFETAWVYDTPALQLDCWMTLALAAARTGRIRLGPGVMVPSLRHPLVTASAIATLVGLVGDDRVVIGAGTGFTGRRAMGQRPISWRDFPEMVRTVQALLRGEAVEIDGAPAQMLHWPGQAPSRPIEVPWYLGVSGPKGFAAAAALGSGAFTSVPRADRSYGGITDVVLLGFGTILDEGETFSSPRVLATAGPGTMVAYHAAIEQADPRLDEFPNGQRFRELCDALDPRSRHLHVHTGHLTELNEIDRQVLVPEAIRFAPFARRADELLPWFERLDSKGITEVAFQPMGDIDRELRAFAAAAELPGG